ncbi:hypothetical protein DACRYDRAFT_23873 [Dacryopinax primogenitus]|uniref:Uncharacterized protein n=1 Tax=Dacryopinax primogenitus (strain DJM 731) TaxID=1858805 RepID=M5FQQ8_DACPD|nr:uncharacterized protein DACRYDRAFT_23873 [Dacryopinax primogenitus]EJT99270.1 hypothetical protein DACRYDRAFT_23873 [Dacryopinax primogenitus]
MLVFEEEDSRNCATLGYRGGVPNWETARVVCGKTNFAACHTKSSARGLLGTFIRRRRKE